MTDSGDMQASLSTSHPFSLYPSPISSYGKLCIIRYRNFMKRKSRMVVILRAIRMMALEEDVMGDNR